MSHCVISNSHSSVDEIADGEIEWYDLLPSVVQFCCHSEEDAVEVRDLAANQLAPAALNEAQRLTREWDAAHPR